MLRNVEKPRSLIDRSEGRKQRKKGVSFGSWKVKSMQRSVLLMTVSANLGNYRLDLQGVHEVTCNKVGTEKAKDYILLPGTDVNIIN